MQKSKVLIVSGYDKNTDATWDNLFKLTLPSKINYATKYGYDIYLTHKFTSDPYNIFKESDIGFLRTVLVFEINKVIKNYKQYDYIFWLDADTIITNPDWTIDHIIDKQNPAVYYASLDWGSGAQQNNLFNNGNWIVKVSEEANQLYDIFLSKAKQFPNEQEALNAINHTPQYSHFFKILDKQILNAVPNYENLVENRNNQKIDSPWNDTHFLCHISGLSNDQRIYLIKKYLNKYINYD